MYNGIGLPTPRGSGTSGYVQKNYAYTNKPRLHQDYQKELEAIKANPPKPPKKPNSEIIAHEQKRQIEIKLITFKQQLEEEELPQEEVERRVCAARKHLHNKLSEAPLMSENTSHHKALQKEKDLQNLREAFKISEDYQPGSAFDFEAIEKKRQEEKDSKRKRSRSRSSSKNSV